MVLATAARRSSSVCLSCQLRQSILSRRPRGINISRRRSQSTSAALATKEPDDDFLPSTSVPPSSTDLSFSALSTNRDSRIAVLRTLRNPFPPHPSGRQPPRVPLISAKPFTIPHNVFRQNLKTAFGFKETRRVLRVQLLQCSTPRAILRVVAVAFTTSPNAAIALSALEEPIIRALYRCRDTISDPEVLGTLEAIIWRFEQTEYIVVDPQLRYMALKFAARSRSLKSMKRQLRALRREGRELSSNMFRSIIAKCSIGHRGLGEIRNGRWRRGELIQVLLGFEGDEEMPPCNLGSFLERDDWQFLHGWVAVLARCKESEAVWREWEFWKVSPSRRRARALERPQGWSDPMRQEGEVTSRSRGDYWFLEQVVMSGNLEGAWKVLRETGIVFSTVKMKVRDKMLEGPEFVTVWDDGVKAAMVEKWDRDLKAIEKALGVKWMTKQQGLQLASKQEALEGPVDIIGEDSNAEGWHELFMDQEEALDKLGEEGWRLDEEYGFPYEDEGMIVPEGERELHEAVEVVSS